MDTAQHPGHPGHPGNHANPPPSTPGRPRAKSGFSFRSHDSGTAPTHASKSPKSKHERKESASDKRKTHYDPTTKANPNAAMNEAQPIAAALEKPTLQSLRSFKHNDVNGNPIAEPDLSNPTRSRWERPLDTIRSFEASIDGEYKRRTIAMRADQTDVGSTHGSRRSSYYGGAPEQQRYSQASYYGHRAQRESYDNGYAMGGPVGGPQRARHSNRMQSDPGWNNRQGNNVYGPPNPYHQSRDTVHTNGSGGSHSDGPSDNSSFERAAPVKSPHDGPEWGWQAQGDPSRQGPGYFPSQQQQQLAQQQLAQQQQQQQQAPLPPAKNSQQMPARVPIRLDNSAQSPPAANGRPKVLSKNGSDDKRKSWFKRRFSKD